MSTPTTPTPKTDAFREQFKHCGSFTKYRREAERFCGELETSLGQWKAVAERLADALKLTKGKWTFSSGQVHTHTWHDWADCIVPVTESLAAYNKLKNSTK